MKITIIANIEGLGIRAHVAEASIFDPVKYLRDNPKVVEVQSEVWTMKLASTSPRLRYIVTKSTRTIFKQ